MKEIETNGLKSFIYIDNYRIFKKYLVSTDQIKDVHGEEMAYFVFFFEKDKLELAQVYNFTTQFYIKIIVALIILILIMLFMSGLIVWRLIVSINLAHWDNK